MARRITESSPGGLQGALRGSEKELALILEVESIPRECVYPGEMRGIIEKVNITPEEAYVYLQRMGASAMGSNPFTEMELSLRYGDNAYKHRVCNSIWNIDQPKLTDRKDKLISLLSVPNSKEVQTINHPVRLEKRGTRLFLVTGNKSKLLHTLRSEMPPDKLLGYLLQRPGQVVTRGNLNWEFGEAVKKLNIPETIRQMKIPRELKPLFFPTCENDKIQLCNPIEKQKTRNTL